jgi:hypothetical protein
MKKFRIWQITLLVFVLVVVGALVYFDSRFKPNKNGDWGLNFSVKYAEELGIDWKTMYLDMLNDLKPKKLRLMSYWDRIEPERGKFDFNVVDQQLIEAGKRNIEVVLVVGRKQPRWPECHEPQWFETLNKNEQEQAQLSMVKTAVEHFKQFGAVKIWQVENEPFFPFGPSCPRMDKNLVKAEMDAVRSLDSRPIMLTDSGELGLWVQAASLHPDILGSTMYRVVHKPKFGYLSYPLPPTFFHIKAGIVNTFVPVPKIMGVELQAEPWFDKGVNNMDLSTQLSLMNAKIFDDYIDYAKEAGLGDNYLWGVEWWYWLAMKQNDWSLWESARQLLNNH